MSERNKTLTRRFYEEVFNQMKLSTVDGLCAPGVYRSQPRARAGSWRSRVKGLDVAISPGLSRPQGDDSRDGN